jgi:hypothetical protein
VSVAEESFPSASATATTGDGVLEDAVAEEAVADNVATEDGPAEDIVAFAGTAVGDFLSAAVVGGDEERDDCAATPSLGLASVSLSVAAIDAGDCASRSGLGVKFEASDGALLVALLLARLLTAANPVSRTLADGADAVVASTERTETGTVSIAADPPAGVDGAATGLRAGLIRAEPPDLRMSGIELLNSGSVGRGDCGDGAGAGINGSTFARGIAGVSAGGLAGAGDTGTGKFENCVDALENCAARLVDDCEVSGPAFPMLAGGSGESELAWIGTAVFGGAFAAPDLSERLAGSSLKFGVRSVADRSVVAIGLLEIAVESG